MGDPIQPKLDLSPPRRQDPRPEIEISSPGLAALERQAVEGPKAKTRHRPKKEPKTPGALAKRNADAYPAPRSLGTVFTALFLGAGAGAIYTGIKWGTALGKVTLSQQASKGADQFFDSSGNLTDAAKDIPFSPLTTLLNNISEKAQSENKDIQDVLDGVEDKARDEEKVWRQKSVALGVASGVGVLGMMIFFTAAPIIRHRGNVLFDGDSVKRHKNGKPTSEVRFSPSFDLTGASANLAIRF